MGGIGCTLFLDGVSCCKVLLVLLLMIRVAWCCGEANLLSGGFMECRIFENCEYSSNILLMFPLDWE
jgi:hypothetical protein